jgi:cyclase
MVPVQGTVDVAVPIDVLWKSFAHANLWPRWNKCFFWVRNTNLVKGQHLIWTFQPIKPWYPYKMWAIANIVEMEPGKTVTWAVTALPGMYARHTYHVEDLGNGRTRFGSWEQGIGWGFRPMRWFWLKHFTFVKDESLAGALQLEQQYKSTGALNESEMPKKSYVGFWVVIALLLLLLGGLIAGCTFYEKYVRVTAIELAPGVHALMGGGGNSLVVEDGGETLVVDTKFPPGSEVLRRWISHHVQSPVKIIVNTHYHYDHTEGNSLYPDADRVAFRETPVPMKKFDDDWWSAHARGVPTNLMDDSRVLHVGSIEVQLTHPMAAHTSGDLWVYLPKQGVIATGDLVFHGYYPFMDQPEGGTSIPGMIAIVRELARDYPNARFMPGHGAMATAADLRTYADYLEALNRAVIAAHAGGLSAEAAASRIDLSSWHLSILPSFHHKKMVWATAVNDVRWAYFLSSSSTRQLEQ